jgi:ankyrin repeat protein
VTNISQHNNTLRYLAAQHGHKEVVEQLLDHNALVSQTNPDTHGWTALHAAAAELQEEVLQVLLERKASVDHCTADGSTALLLLCARGVHGSEQSLSVARLLVKAGADVQKTDGLVRFSACCFCC